MSVFLRLELAVINGVSLGPPLLTWVNSTDVVHKDLHVYLFGNYGSIITPMILHINSAVYIAAIIILNLQLTQCNGEKYQRLNRSDLKISTSLDWSEYGPGLAWSQTSSDMCVRCSAGHRQGWFLNVQKHIHPYCWRRCRTRWCWLLLSHLKVNTMRTLSHTEMDKDIAV